MNRAHLLIPVHSCGLPSHKERRINWTMVLGDAWIYWRFELRRMSTSQNRDMGHRATRAIYALSCRPADARALPQGVEFLTILDIHLLKSI